MRKIVIIALGAVLLLSPWLFDVVRTTMRKTFLLTTADPDALGGVATASTKPMDVTLHARRSELIMSDGPTGKQQVATGRTIDQKITFRAPAAYFSIIYLKEGPAGAQEVGFAAWADTFEPSQPDLIRALSKQKPTSLRDLGKPRPPEPPDPELADLRARHAREDTLQFEVSNYYKENRLEQPRNLDYFARIDSPLPCDRLFDPDLSMTVVSVPDGKRASESCLGGTSDNARTYLKYNVDGSPKFAAVCGGSGPKGQPLRNSCRLNGHFGNWPLFVWVPAQKPEKWNAYFDRIQQFLSSITVKQKSQN